MIAMAPLSPADVAKYELPAGNWVGAEVRSKTGLRGLGRGKLLPARVLTCLHEPFPNPNSSINLNNS